MPKNAKNVEEFKSVKKTNRTMAYSWMPRVNTNPQYPDPWRPGKLTVFDLTKKLSDVIGDMVVYHIRLMLAKHRAMDKMDEDTLKDYFSELQTSAYEKAWKGLRCWKPAYGLNLYVQNHVRFAAMGLKSLRVKEEKKGTNAKLVRSSTVSDMALTFAEAMEMADAYIDQGKDSEAAVLYEKICRDTAADYAEDLDMD